MEPDVKLKIAVLGDLETWQKLNVVTFLMSGVAAGADIVGKPYRDADGNEYLPMARVPAMIHAASSAAELRALLEKARTKEVILSIYTRELFSTLNDAANRNAVAQVKAADLDLVGLAVYGKKTHVDKLFKNLPLHK